MKFHAVLTNPPFQDSEKRGRTPHKLWIEFTQHALENWLVDDGVLGQVSPASFMSPSNRVLGLMKRYRPDFISFDTARYFPKVGSSFAHYVVRKQSSEVSRPATRVVMGGVESALELDDEVLYLPTVLSSEALSVHRKVVFESQPKLKVEWDYVTCHNVLLRKSNTLSREQTEQHRYPVFHTNRQTWWSSIRQPFAGEMKVMWSRSGYTVPFFDAGQLGCTDMGYFVRVQDASTGVNLAHNMNLLLMRYVYKTAKWSGFGNELVFRALPALPSEGRLNDGELFDFFELSANEVEHVVTTMG